MAREPSLLLAIAIGIAIVMIFWRWMTWADKARRRVHQRRRAGREAEEGRLDGIRCDVLFVIDPYREKFMRLLIVAVLVLAGPAASAQTVIDGSDEQFDPAHIREMMAAVTDDFREPGSAQFRALDRLDDEGLCGEVNAKNAYGGYNGFASFYYKAPAASDSTEYPIPTDPLSIIGPSTRPCREVFGSQ